MGIELRTSRSVVKCATTWRTTTAQDIVTCQICSLIRTSSLLNLEVYLLSVAIWKSRVLFKPRRGKEALLRMSFWKISQIRESSTKQALSPRNLDNVLPTKLGALKLRCNSICDLFHLEQPQEPVRPELRWVFPAWDNFRSPSQSHWSWLVTVRTWVRFLQPQNLFKCRYKICSCQYIPKKRMQEKYLRL